MTCYVATIRLSTPTPLEEDTTDRLLDTLDASHGVLSTGLAERATGDGVPVEVTVDVDADTLTAAAARAVQVAQAALREAGAPTPLTVRGLEVQTVAEQEWALAHPVVPELVGLSEVAEMLGVSRQRVGHLRAHPQFPAPVGEPRCGPIWTHASLLHFLHRWQRRRGRRPATTGGADQAAATSKTTQIADHLTRAAATASPGEHLASVTTLQDQFDASIGTVVAGAQLAVTRGAPVHSRRGPDGGYFRDDRPAVASSNTS